MWGVAFSSDGKLVAGVNSDGEVTIWDLQTRTELVSLRHNGVGITRIAFDLRCKHLAAGCEDGSVLVWNLASPQTPIILAGRASRVKWVAFTGDEQCPRLASASEDGTVTIWDPILGMELLTIRAHASAGADGTAPLRSAAFHPTLSVLATAGADGTVRIWDARPPAERRAPQAVIANR
jgi:WD40 repeat protein